MKPGKKRYTGKSLILILTLVMVTALSGCKKNNDDNKPVSQPTPANPPANEVWIQGNNTYNPSTITVSANTTITWRNKDVNYTHTVTGNNGEFDSGVIASGATFSHQFTTAGTYNYHCALHSMSGQVIVQ